MISCKEYVETRQEKLIDEIKKLNKVPKLCVFQIGSDPASEVYVRNKHKLCDMLGIDFEHIHITDYENLTNDDISKMILDKNLDKSVSGIIVQLPLPKQFDSKFITNCIYTHKDVDGFKDESLHTPCTPKGIMDYLKYNGVDFVGKECVVIGRSDIVGKPLVNLLINEGATVTCCNSKTKNIKKYTKSADIVISAIGKANFFDKSYFSKKQILVDVGINRDEEGKLCGDITKIAKKRALLATPVPGGVGILTTNALMENVVDACRLE